MGSVTAKDYAGVMSQRVASESRPLAASWLVRLKEILPVAANEVFASDQLLDHIPALVVEIAAYLSAPSDNEIAANAAVMAKASELGILRHQQQASVHQLLHAYQILGDILEGFLIEVDGTARPPAVHGRMLSGAAPADACGPRSDADHRRYVRRRIHLDDSGADRADSSLQPDRQPRDAIADRENYVFAATLLDTPDIRQDPQRLSKVVATVRSSAERLTWLVENLQRIARMGDTIDVPSQQRVAGARGRDQPL